MSTLSIVTYIYIESNIGGGLAPEEKFVITAWHIPLAIGLYVTCTSAGVFVLTDAAVRWLTAKFVRTTDSAVESKLPKLE